MRLDTDLPLLGMPEPGSNLCYSEWFRLIKKTKPTEAEQMTSIPKWRAWVLDDTTLFYFISLNHIQIHIFFQTAITRSTLHSLLEEGFFVVLSAVHQTYCITLRLRDHNRLSWITCLPYINVQWNVSCIKNTKTRICEDLTFLKCFVKIALKQLEIKFQFGIFFELLNLKKLALKMKIGCSTVSVHP